MSQAELNLDQLLAGMAEDVPPMPAGFHDQWMNAVREEAKQAEMPAPAPVSQWPRILSVAAVFVFLIGGTLIYRSARKPLLPGNEAVSAMTVTEGAVNEDAAMEEAVNEEAAMKEAAMKEAAADQAETVEDAMEAVYEAAESAGRTDAAPAPAAGSNSRKEIGAKSAEAVNATGVMMAAEEASMPDYAMEEAEEADGAAVDAAETPVTEAPATEAPVTEAPATEAPATEAPAAAPERTGIGGFFADMGDFLLEVWPYVLIAVVPLIIAAGVKRFRKK